MNPVDPQVEEVEESSADEWTVISKKAVDPPRPSSPSPDPDPVDPPSPAQPASLLSLTSPAALPSVDASKPAFDSLGTVPTVGTTSQQPHAVGSPAAQPPTDQHSSSGTTTVPRPSAALSHPDPPRPPPALASMPSLAKETSAPDPVSTSHHHPQLDAAADPQEKLPPTGTDVNAEMEGMRRRVHGPSSGAGTGHETKNADAGLNAPGASDPSPASPLQSSKSPTAVEPAPAPASAPTASQEEPEGRLCRICFAGPEEEPALGRLISPCRCKGTMKHVHIECLNQWRQRAARSSSYFQCDQCGYKYHFSRTAWASVLRNELIVTLVTLLVFILTVLIAGFIAKFLILYAFSDPVPADLPPPPPVTVRRRPDSPPSGAGLNRLTPIVIEKMAEDDYEDDYLDLFDLFFAYMDPGKIRLWAIDITHMVSGIFLVGFFGGISMLYYFVMNPMGLNVRLNARRGGDNMSAILILLLVTYGTFKALWGIYKTVKRVSRQSLQMVESTILDISEAGEGAHVFAPSGTVGNAHGSRERAGIANAVGLGGAAAEGPGAWAEVH